MAGGAINVDDNLGLMHVGLARSQFQRSTATCHVPVPRAQYFIAKSCARLSHRVSAEAIWVHFSLCLQPCRLQMLQLHHIGGRCDISKVDWIATLTEGNLDQGYDFL